MEIPGHLQQIRKFWITLDLVREKHCPLQRNDRTGVSQRILQNCIGTLECLWMLQSGHWEASTSQELINHHAASQSHNTSWCEEVYGQSYLRARSFNIQTISWLCGICHFWQVQIPNNFFKRVFIPLFQIRNAVKGICFLKML
jgi:hypothetical protein